VRGSSESSVCGLSWKQQSKSPVCIDPKTQHSIATSNYGKTEGWIEGYIRQWLADDSLEFLVAYKDDLSIGRRSI
jgi:hypothetical protein